MPDYPYIEETKKSIICHFTEFSSVSIPAYEIDKLYELLTAYCKNNIVLNNGQWNGAVATLSSMGGRWPKIIEQYGGFDTALFRAEGIYKKTKQPTLAFALIGSFGIKQEEIITDLGDECEIFDDYPTTTKNSITLDSF